MSRLFGEVRQNGYVVDDLDEAVRHWTGVLGIGPFFRIDTVPLDYFRYRGEPTDVRIAIALGFSGGVQFELIQQLNDAPSPYRDFVVEYGYGLHHVSSWSESYDRDRETIGAAGISVIAEGKITDGPRFTYFDTATAISGTMMEMADFTPALSERSARMRKVCAEWDGSDPMRPNSAL